MRGSGRPNCLARNGRAGPPAGSSAGRSPVERDGPSAARRDRPGPRQHRGCLGAASPGAGPPVAWTAVGRCPPGRRRTIDDSPAPSQRRRWEWRDATPRRSSPPLRVGRPAPVPPRRPGSVPRWPRLWPVDRSTGRACWCRAESADPVQPGPGDLLGSAAPSGPMEPADPMVRSGPRPAWPVVDRVRKANSTPAHQIAGPPRSAWARRTGPGCRGRPSPGEHPEPWAATVTDHRPPLAAQSLSTPSPTTHVCRPAARDRPSPAIPTSTPTSRTTPMSFLSPICGPRHRRPLAHRPRSARHSECRGFRPPPGGPESCGAADWSTAPDWPAETLPSTTRRPIRRSPSSASRSRSMRRDRPGMSEPRRMTWPRLRRSRLRPMSDARAPKTRMRWPATLGTSGMHWRRGRAAVMWPMVVSQPPRHRETLVVEMSIGPPVWRWPAGTLLVQMLADRMAMVRMQLVRVRWWSGCGWSGCRWSGCRWCGCGGS